MDYLKTFQPEKSQETKKDTWKQLLILSGWSVLTGAIFGLGHALTMSLYVNMIKKFPFKN
jgi:hypothetical protein